MKINFLGTNGWYDTVTGNTVCVFIQTEEYSLILDAGNGIFKLDQHIDLDKPVYLFISHFHLDHIIGLHILGKFNFQKGLFICGRNDIEATLKNIINETFTIPFEKLNFKTNFIELPKDEQTLPFKVKSLPLKHSTPALGYRFNLDNKVLAYCTDTGYCSNALELSKDADLLITECSFKSGQDNPEWPHLNPESAARLAKESHVRRLSLIHFDASLYKTLDERRIAEERAQGIFVNTFVAYDNMSVDI